jgi:hypothetical protein
LATLSRRPSEEESREAVEYVDRQDDKTKALAGVLWMLLNRSEFVLER